MLGWTPATYDAHNALYSLVASRKGSRGELNDGGYSNPRIDALTDQIGTETDQAKRNAMIDEAITILQQDVGVIPLHQQVIVWASKTNVAFAQMADDYFPYRYIMVK
jgi:peptide/nickel transport system substrate-binding protein